MTSRGFGEGVAQSGSDVPAGELPRSVAAVPDPEVHPPVSPTNPTSAARQAEPRLALLIGNARYASGTSTPREPFAVRSATHADTLNSLETPVADVRMLADLLASLGFVTNKVENADRTAMRDALAAFAARLEAAGPDAVAFVYYAGHGFQDEGINYLIPIGAELDKRDRLRAETLAVDDIVQALVRHPRKANAIVLDACRKTPLGLRLRTRDVTQGLADLKLPPKATMLVAYSTSAGATAEDDVVSADGNSSRHSPYATALMQSLPGLLEPDRRIYEVFVEAAERIKRATNDAQAPALYLQGVAPPLNATRADRRRFEKWRARQRNWRERSLQVVGALTVVVAVAAAGLLWYGSYPETRARWLAAGHVRALPWRAWQCSETRIDGFLRPRGCEICSLADGERDRFGLTRQDWCRTAPYELLASLKRDGRWNQPAEFQLAESGDIVAMTLLAAGLDPNDFALEDWEISEARRSMLPLAVRAARAGWLPAWVIVQRLTADADAVSSVVNGEILQGLLDGHSAGIAPASAALAQKQ